MVVRLKIPNADSVMIGQENLSAVWKDEYSKATTVKLRKELFERWERALLYQKVPPNEAGFEDFQGELVESHGSASPKS